MQDFKQITLQLERDTLDRLKMQAHKEGDRPVASLIREILQIEIVRISSEESKQEE